MLHHAFFIALSLTVLSLVRRFGQKLNVNVNVKLAFYSTSPSPHSSIHWSHLVSPASHLNQTSCTLGLFRRARHSTETLPGKQIQKIIPFHFITLHTYFLTWSLCKLSAFHTVPSSTHTPHKLVFDGVVLCCANYSTLR